MINNAQSTLRQVYQAIGGFKVPLDGYLGTYISSTLYYVDNSGTYEVVLDAGREVRRQLEGCEVNPWRPEASSCRVTGWAELVANWEETSLADGVGVDLLVYELTVER